jgi:hypothetical protein
MRASEYQHRPPPCLGEGAGTSRRTTGRVSSISRSHRRGSAGDGVKDQRLLAGEVPERLHLGPFVCLVPSILRRRGFVPLLARLRPRTPMPGCLEAACLPLLERRRSAPGGRSRDGAPAPPGPGVGLVRPLVEDDPPCGFELGSSPGVIRREGSPSNRILTDRGDEPVVVCIPGGSYLDT